MAAPPRVVGGKLRLKGSAGAALVAASGGSGGGPMSAGIKRGRAEELAPRAAAAAEKAGAVGAGGSSGGASGAPVAAPSKEKGLGRIVTSGTTVHGFDGSAFLQQFRAGDAIQIAADPASGRAEETRVVSFVLSNASASLSAPFDADVISKSTYFVLKLPRSGEDPAAAATAAADKKRREAAAAVGEFAGSVAGGGSGATGAAAGGAAGSAAAAGGGGDVKTVVAYRAKSTGGHGGYKMAQEVVSGKALSREEMLDLRAKKSGRDKYC